MGVFLPFAAGYYLSYLFRTINTLISYPLSVELDLNAADCGLLTSIYFLVFAIAQIPIGILLDRFGPRRVQSVLLLIAAAGAALFGVSTGFASALIARAMIGFGVAASLMAGLKAIVLWFPKERVALTNGYMIMLGTLGAVTATLPADWLVHRFGWRGLFELLAVASACIAGLIYLVVPESARPKQLKSTSLGLKTVYSDMRFWRIAPLSAACIGSAWSLQALWAAPWLADVEGLSQQSLVTELFVMAIEISIGAWLLGTIADWLRRSGTTADVLLAFVAVLFVAAELAIILRLPMPALVPWSIVSLVGAGTVISYAIVAEQFPMELAARANGGLNLLHFGWAFFAQYGTGLIVAQWEPHEGRYPVIAYQSAFGFNVVVQILALTWFVFPGLRAAGLRLVMANSGGFDGRDSLSEAIVAPAEVAMLEPCENAEW
jgi:predicted MFS family arabinose efflux permease